MSKWKIENGKTYICHIGAGEEDLRFRSIDVTKDDIAVSVDSRIHAIVTCNEQKDQLEKGQLCVSLGTLAEE